MFSDKLLQSDRLSLHSLIGTHSGFLEVHYGRGTVPCAAPRRHSPPVVSGRRWQLRGERVQPVLETTARQREELDHHAAMCCDVGPDHGMLVCKILGSNPACQP